MNYVLSCPFNLSKDTNRVLFEITSKCNMHCKHCLYYSSEYNNFNNDLTTEEILKIIRQLKENAINEVWISGGEPLLRNDIFDIMKKISESGMKPSISSNGYLIDKECAKKLKECNVNYVHLSIDGINSEIHDNFRGKQGAFEHVMRAVDFLRSENIIVGATYMVTNENLLDIETMIQIAINKDISVISFYPISPLGRGVNLVNKDDNYKLIILINERLKSLINKYGNQIRIELFRTIDKSKNNTFLKECKGQYFFTITNEGDLGPCPWLMKSRYNPIKISLKEKSFNEAKKIIQKEMQKFILQREKKMLKCSECIGKDICGKGCPAVSDDEYYDPLCYYTRREK